MLDFCVSSDKHPHFLRYNFLSKEFMTTKMYAVKGKSYPSLEEVPEEYRGLFEKTREFNLTAKDKSYTIVYPDGGKPMQFRLWLVRNFFPAVALLVSLAENFAMEKFGRIFGYFENSNILISFVVASVIGIISQKLAVKSYKGRQTEVVFSGDLNFLNNIQISMISSIYAGVLNGFFLGVLAFLQKVIF